MAIQSFRVATFNTENLLHPGVRFLGRPDDAYTQSQYDEKMRWIRSILRDGRVDLVGFQEQFSERALLDATKEGELQHVYAPDLAGGKNVRLVDGVEHASGPFVALASRFEIVDATSIVEFPEGTRALQVQTSDAGGVVEVPITRFQRPVIRARVQLKPGIVASVFVAHLKSKRPQFLASEGIQAQRDPLVRAIGSTRSLLLRAAESVALRKLLLDELQGTNTPVIVLGDLNDDVSSVSTQIIAGEAPYFKQGHDEKEQAWDRLLYSAHDLEEAESYRDVSYSHIFDGRYQLLDHIFVSQEFVAANPKRIGAVRSTRIFNDHLVDVRRFDDAGLNGPSLRSDHGVPVTEIWWRT
jgi:endonuclease/exonuclease/phosphatase family metal-dependent hydrolase